MALKTKTGDCDCGRENVTLYENRKGGWYCGKCLRKAQAKDMKYR